jgi:hypothetical protein
MKAHPKEPAARKRDWAEREASTLFGRWWRGGNPASELQSTLVRALLRAEKRGYQRGQREGFNQGFGAKP